MKKIKFTLIALVLLMPLWLTAQQPGTYYLYNEGAGMYLNYGGTDNYTACFKPHGEPLKLAASGSGFTVQTALDSRYLSATASSENARQSMGTEFTFTQQSDGSYTISSTAGFMGFGGTVASNLAGTLVQMNLTDGTSANAHWQLLTKEDLMARFSSASPSNPVDATFLVTCPNFDRHHANLSSWENLVMNTNTGSNSGYLCNNAAYQFNSRTVIKQTISNVPNGVYLVKAQAFYRHGSNTVATGYAEDEMPLKGYMFAGANEVLVHNVLSSQYRSATDIYSSYGDFGRSYGGGYIPYGKENTYAGACIAFDAGLYPGNELQTTVTDGNLTIGFKVKDLTQYSWIAYDNIELYYLGASNATNLNNGSRGYLYNPATGKFLSHGQTYAGEAGAYVEEYGVPMEIDKDDNPESDALTDADHIYVHFRLADFTPFPLRAASAGINFRDNNTSQWAIRQVSPESDSFYIRSMYDKGSTHKGDYLAINSDDALVSVSNIDDAAIWRFVGPTEQRSLVENAANARLAAVAAQADINASNETELLNALSNLNSIDMTSKIVNASMTENMDGWNVNKIDGDNFSVGSYTIENACPNQSITTQTVSGLPEGLYKVTLQGYYRATSNDRCIIYGNAGYKFTNAYLRANDNVVAIHDWYSISTDNFTKPGSRGDIKDVFGDAKYTNTVYTYVGSDGKLNLTLGVPSFSTNVGGDYRNWIVFNNMTLTFYGELDPEVLLQQAIDKWHNKYDAIVNQATDHSAFDAKMEEAIQNCTSVAQVSEYDEILWNEVTDLLKNGTTTSGLPFDITSLIENPSFDTDTNGWNVSKDSGELRYSSYGLADLFNTPNGSLTQTLQSMPAGNYTLKAQAFYRSASEQDASWRQKVGTDVVKGSILLGSQSQLLCNLYDQSRYVPALMNGTFGGARQMMVPNSKQSCHEAFNIGQYWNIINTTTTADGNLNLGVKIEGGSGNNWLVFDNFRLYYSANPIDIPVDLTAGLPTEDMEASSVTTGITLNAGEYNKVCLPFSLNATQTADAFSAAYTLAGVTSDGVGQLVPAYTIEAGKPYYVTVASTKTLNIDSPVRICIAQPDNAPVMWEGASTVGTFNGFTFDVNASQGYSISSLAPVDFQNMSITVNQENWRARRYLNEFTYTESVAPRIEEYNQGRPFPLDTPHSTFIPVPQNSSALTVTVSKNEDYSDPETFSFDAGTILCELPNLIPQNNYYYKVEAGGSVLTKGQIHTEGRLRMIKAPTGFNIRDLGGWETANGKRLNYGKVFRGGEINFGHPVSETDLAELRRIGIGADIDWRRNDECGGSEPTSSPIGGAYIYFNHDYANMSFGYDVNQDHYRRAFNFTLENLRNGNAVYFHCRIGADRTGMYAMLLEGLCGMTYDQLCKDYELTTYSTDASTGTRKKDSGDFTNNFNYINALSGNTLQQKFFNYWNKEVGINANDLLEFVDIMVGDLGSLGGSDLGFLNSDNEYIQSMDDITAQCPNGSTAVSGKKAVLSKDGVTVQELEMTVEGFIITFEELTTPLQPESNYTLTIPAGAIEKDGVENAASVTLNFRTPALLDGLYYFRNTDTNYTNKYISRGGRWATQAIMGDYGLAAHVSTNSNNETTIQFFDNDKWLGDDGFCYTDGDANRMRKFNVTKVQGGYKFLNTNNNKYLAVFQGQTVADAAEGDNLEGATNIWALETTEEYLPQYDRNTANQITAVATAAGYTDVTTASELAAKFQDTQNITIPTVDRARSLNEYAPNSEAGGVFNVFEKEVTGLANGVYKLTCKAMQRASTYPRTDAALGARGLIYVYANDSKTQIVSCMEQGASTEYEANYYSSRTGLNYPNNSGSTYTAFDNGLYDNEVWVYVTDGTLKFGINNPSRLGGNFETYVVYGDFALTYYYNLSSLVSAYRDALAAAKVTNAKEDKMAPSLHSALATVIDTYDLGKVDENSVEALEEAIAALVPATQKCETSIRSYAILASGSIPDNSLDGWVCTNTNTFHINTWSGEGNEDGSNMKTPFIENWIYKGGQLGAGKIYYRLECLEPGDLVYAEALVRSYNEASTDAPNGPNFYINNTMTDLPAAGTTFTYNEMSGIYATLSGEAVIGEDGVLELGVVIAENRNYNWIAIKNVKLQSFDSVYDDLVEKIHALEGNVPADVYTTAAQAIPATRPTTTDGLRNAVQAMEAAYAVAEPFVVPYTGYLKLKAYADALVAVPYEELVENANSALATAITTAETSILNVTTPAENEAVNAALKSAMVAYAGNANPTGEGKFNLTFMLTNPDLTNLPSWKKCDGWYTDQPDGNSQVMNNDNATSEDGTKTKFYEYWSNPAKANGLFDLYQKTTIPMGSYQISCYAFAQREGGESGSEDIRGVYFYVNDTQGSQVANSRLEYKEVEFVNNEEQEVKIGLKSMSPNKYNWMGIGYVELYKVPAKEYIIDPNAPMISNDSYKGYDYTLNKAGKVTVVRSLGVQFNAVVLPFSMTQEEVEETFGEGSKVYILRDYSEEKDLLSFDVREGVLPNQPCLIKATVAGEGQYVIEGRMLVASETPNPEYAPTANAKMTGVYHSKLILPDYSLYIKGGQFVYAPVGVESWVNTTRAYVTIKDWQPGANGVKTINVSFGDDEATAIALISNDGINILEGKVYDLSGREVNNPNKGIYIINGKKVLIK